MFLSPGTLHHGGLTTHCTFLRIVRRKEYQRIKELCTSYAVFRACWSWANADGWILLMAALNAASPWRAAHAFKFPLSTFSSDACLIGSESFTWSRQLSETVPLQSCIWKWTVKKSMTYLALPQLFAWSIGITWTIIAYPGRACNITTAIDYIKHYRQIVLASRV